LSDFGGALCDGDKLDDGVRIAETAHRGMHYHTDDSTSDFMSATAVAASLNTPLHLTSVKIARREIQYWNPLPTTGNPLKEWRRGVNISTWLSLLARHVLTISSTFASPEHLFLPLAIP